MLVETTRVNEFEYYLACTHKGRSPIFCHESWQNVKSIHCFDSRAAWLTRTGLCAAWHNHNLDALNCCSSSRKLPVNNRYTETRFSDQEKSSEFINYAAANSLAIQQLNSLIAVHELKQFRQFLEMTFLNHTISFIDDDIAYLFHLAQVFLTLQQQTHVFISSTITSHKMIVIEFWQPWGGISNM